MKNLIPHMTDRDFYHPENTAHPHAHMFSMLVEIGGGGWSGAEFRKRVCAIAGIDVDDSIGDNDRVAWQKSMNLLIDVWNSFSDEPTDVQFEDALKLKVAER